MVVARVIAVSQTDNAILLRICNRILNANGISQPFPYSANAVRPLLASFGVLARFLQLTSATLVLKHSRQVDRCEDSCEWLRIARQGACLATARIIAV
jgi:hypothetical protein